MLVHIYQLILQFFIHKFSLHLHTYLYLSTKIILHSLQNQQASKNGLILRTRTSLNKHTIHCSYKHDNSLVLPVHFPLVHFKYKEEFHMGYGYSCCGYGYGGGGGCGYGGFALLIVLFILLIIIGASCWGGFVGC